MSYDILLDDDLDLPEFSVHTTGIAIVAQRVHIRLSMFKGEWMLDTRQGLPFVDWLTQKVGRRRLDEIAARVRREITSTPGVISLDNYSATISGRTIVITGRVHADDGSTDLTISSNSLASGNNQSSFWLVGMNMRGPISPL